MQLYVADYLGDTRHLTAEQHGAYLLLLMTMWRSGGRLPNDPKKLARIACCTGSRWGKIGDEVMAFFDVEGGEITNKRLVFELEKASEKSIKRAAAGSLGGKANSLKYNKQPEAKAARSPMHSSEPETEEESPLPPKGGKKARRAATSIPDGFPDMEALKVGRDLVLEAGVAVHVRTEADKFRDYAAGRDWKKVDWLATWRNWLRSACERAPKLGLAVSQTQNEEHDPWPYRVRVWLRQEGWNDVDWGPEPFEPGCRVPPEHLPRRAAE